MNQQLLLYDRPKFRTVRARILNQDLECPICLCILRETVTVMGI